MEMKTKYMKYGKLQFQNKNTWITSNKATQSQNLLQALYVVLSTIHFFMLTKIVFYLVILFLCANINNNKYFKQSEKAIAKFLYSLLFYTTQCDVLEQELTALQKLIV